MPILKVPIVHKFGIISHSQRLELQDRLLKEAFAKAEERKAHIARNPFEVTDDFIKKYNSAETHVEKLAVEEAAQKVLLRVKRRIGIRDGCNGDHVNIPFGWTELTLLAQCRGQVHQDCLDVLLLSLELAPVGKYQIPALFYLAETVLYWLQTEAAQQPYLRAAEMKLLKIGFVVFLRLYYHHMAGQLRQQRETRARLALYLEGFDEHQDMYRPYPDVLLNAKFICSVGKILTADVANSQAVDGSSPEDNSPDVENKAPQAARHGGSAMSGDSRNGALSTEVHDLSPALWHSLDVWRCARHLGGDLSDALQALERCAQSLHTETWVDSLLAFVVLADAALESAAVLRVIQRIAAGLEGSSGVIKAVTDNPANYNSLMATGSIGAIPAFSDLSGSALSSDIPSSSGGTGEPSDDDDDSDSPVFAGGPSRRPAAAGHRRERHAVPGTSSPGPDAATLAAAAAAVSTQRSQPTQGLLGWPWEVAVGFVQLLGGLVLHGLTSKVREGSLCGSYRGSPVSLAQLANFKDEPKGDKEEFAWKIRYTALQGLVSVYKSIDPEDNQRETFRATAFNEMSKVQRNEKDTSVMEALKTGEISAQLERCLRSLVKVQPSFIGGKVAHALSVLYLPSLPPPVQLQPRPSHHKPLPKPQPVKVHTMRNTLMQEVQLNTALPKQVPNYRTRKDFELFRVVEDQWRKDLHQKLESEEKERAETLNEEFQQKAKAQAKLEKFKARRC